MFQAITGRARPREGNERRAIGGSGRERAAGRAIHHSSDPWRSHCHSTETLTNKYGMEAESHATPRWGVRASRRGGGTGKNGEMRVEGGGAIEASLVDFMSLEPGVTASSPPATSREKNGYGMWGVVDGGDREKRRRRRRGGGRAGRGGGGRVGG